MNKSPQYNQQNESKVEETCVYQNMKRGCHSTYIYLKINSGFHAQKGSQTTTTESNHVQ